MAHLTVTIGLEPTYLLEAEGEEVGADDNHSDVYVTAIYRLSEGHVLYDVERRVWHPWPTPVPVDLEMYAQQLLYEELKTKRSEIASARRRTTDVY